MPTAAMPMPYSPLLRLPAEIMLWMSKPVAQRKARTMATAIVTTGMAVDIIPMPIPEMMTVAGPVSALLAIFRVGL